MLKLDCDNVLRHNVSFENSCPNQANNILLNNNNVSMLPERKKIPYILTEHYVHPKFLDYIENPR